MFRAAQFIVRHKIGVVAIAAIAFMVFGRSGNEHKAASPWDTDSVQQAAADANTSLADKALGALNDHLHQLKLKEVASCSE